MIKLTNNEYYNAYENNDTENGEQNKYCVGREGSEDEHMYGYRKNFAIYRAGCLNTEDLNSKSYKCPTCGEWTLNKEYIVDNGFGVCENCGDFIDISKVK